MGFLMGFSVVFSSLESIITFFIIGCVGFFIARSGKVNQGTQRFLAYLVTVVALPSYLFYNISNFITREEFLNFIYSTALPFCSILVAYFTSILWGRVIKVPEGRKGLFTTAFAFSNTIYIGLPVNIALFGKAAIPSVLLYYFANTVLFWSLGVFALASDGENKGQALFSKANLKKAFSPPMWALFAGLAVMLLEIELPSFVMNSAKHLGQLSTPLIMISLGITLFFMGISKIKMDRIILSVFFGRYIFCPLLIVFLTWLVPVPDLTRKVFIIQSSLPVVSSLAMLATYYGGDGEYATLVISSTTLFSMITIPFYMYLMSQFL